MLLKTRGIFLQKVNYSETSLIVRVYTEEAGLQSYLLKGARGKKSRIEANTLQHLALLDMEVYHRANANLQKVKELRISKPFETLPYDIRKSTVLLFLNELLLKVLKEEEASPGLFGFIFDAVCVLDAAQEHIQSFHLIFMLQLSKYLGFSPQEISGPPAFFDMIEGVFTQQQPEHAHFVSGELSGLLALGKHYSIHNYSEFKIDRRARNELLDKLIEFYRLHIPGMGEMKSLEVLRTILA